MVFKNIWRKVSRKTILIEQDNRCYYCFEPLNEGTLDHVKPQCKGGTDDKQNLVVACQPCNLAKGSMSKSQFRKFIKIPGSMHWARRRLWLAEMRAVRNIFRYIGIET